MAQTGYTPILTYASGTASNVPLAANLTSSASGAELALNYADGKLFYKDSSGVVQVLATKAGALGDVVGPASATDNALARFDTTTGKLIQNSVGVLSDTGALSGLTDISASGSVTLSGGTANGVAYLNGSKVLTSGSALTFDGSTFRASGVMELGGTNLLYMSGKTGTHAYLLLGASNTAEDFLIGSDTNIPLIFRTNATEQMRLTSTGLGIGTSSPAYKLDVNGTGRIGTAIFDASGNLGLGVTPSAWASIVGIQSAYGAFSGNINTNIMRNAYYNGGWKYTATGQATHYQQDGGSHYWYTAPSGTAGSAITFTQAMTLTAASTLGVSVASPKNAYSAFAKIEVGDVGGSLLAGTASYSGDQYAWLSNNMYADSSGTLKAYRTKGVATYKLLNAEHQWLIAAGTADTAITFTQAMTLSSDGDLGIGVTSPQARVEAFGSLRASSTTNTTYRGIEFGYTGTAQVYGSVAMELDGGQLKIEAGYSGFGGYQTFHTNGAERARIDSSGNLLVGTTSGSYKVDVSGDVNVTGSYRVNGVATTGLTGGQTGSAPLYGARAWVNFNGTGTVAIRASGNVSSITDNGTGDYTVNFATAMPDTNYATSLAVSPDAAFGSGSAAVRSFFVNSNGTTGVRVITGYQQAPAYLDFPGLYVAVFR